MSRKTHKRTVRSAGILPKAARERLLPWLQKAGFQYRDVAQEPPVAVVDLTLDGGLEALRSLRLAHDATELAVLAIVGDAHEEAERALQSGADGFVALGSLEREFDLRLEAVRRLAVSRAHRARREQDLAALLDLTAHYAAALDVATLLHDVTRKLAEELSIDRCALVLIDEERDQGHIVAASDDRALHDVRIELSRYPEIREALRTCEPVVVDDVASHPLLGEVKEAVASRGISALAAIPLTVQGKTLGVLLLRASGGSFSPAEINFAWTVAHATAIALRNARMLEGLRGQAEKAEAQVAELARYEDFFQFSSDGIVILDETGAIVSLNPAGGEILGLNPARVRGRMFVALASPLSEGTLLEMLVCVRRGLVCRNVDVEMNGADDKVLTLSVCGSSVKDGRVTILSFRDVTAARATERELRKTTEFMEKLINSSVDAIVAANADGTVILYNRSAERVLGYAQSEVIGQLGLRELFPDGLAEQVMALLRSEDHGGAGRLEPTRTEVRAKDGERVPVLLSSALIYEGERAVASVSVFSDLRERNRLEAKLSKAEEKLAEAEKQAVIVELAGTAAHELNQPLTSVMGYAELLKRRLKEDDPGWRPVDIIYREAERMAEIVRKIGKITRHETKAYVGNSRIFDLDKAAGDEE
ncbi:MAG: PAS domain S-box protein [Myxococcales bacterium]